MYSSLVIHCCELALSHFIISRPESKRFELSPHIALQCFRRLFSPRFLTHECAAHDPLASATSIARPTKGTRTCHALHTSIAAIVVPAKGHVVHHEHDRLVVDECLDLNAAQAAEVVREGHVLKRAVIGVRARRYHNLGVVSLNIIASIGIPSRASDVEDTVVRTIIVAAEPGIVGVEPESRQAVVGTVGNVARLGARDDSRHAWLVPSGIVRSITSSGRQEDSELVARVRYERCLVIWRMNISVAKGKMVVRTEYRRRLCDVSVS